MKKMKKLSILIISILLLCSLLSGCQSASDAYPDGDVTIIIPFNAGGGIDISGRALFTEMDDLFEGISFVPTNVTGASGTVGATELYYSDNDGYTLMVAGNGLNVAHISNDFELTFNDYQLVAQYATSQLGLYVRSDSPYETYEELIAAAEANPGEIKMGVLTATVNHYAVLAIEEFSGVSFQHIIVGGDQSPQPELLSGRVDCYVVAVSQNTAYIDSGDFRCLGVFADERVESLPDTPTFAEIGIEEDYQLSFGVWAPAGVSDEVIDTISSAVELICEDEDFQLSMTAMGYTAAYLNTEDYTARMQESLDSVIELSERLDSDGESSIDPYNGPYTFPTILIGAIIVLALIEIIRKIVKKEKFNIRIISLFKGNVIVFLLGLFILALLFEIAGYMISSALFLTGMTLFLRHSAKKEINRKVVIQTILASIAFAIVTYLFFTQVAGIAMPVSILGI